MRTHACITCVALAGGPALGQFSIGSVDFGGGFDGTQGSPLVPVGGSLHALQYTDPAIHALGYYEDWLNDGWGISFGAIEDNAPTAIPATNGVLDVNIADAVVPALGAGAATSSSFGGYYERGPVPVSDNDAFVARVGVFGGSLATSGPVFVSVQGENDSAPSVLGIDETGVIDTSIGDNRTDGMAYWLEFRLLGSYEIRSGTVTVYDTFVVVPTPGTIALFGVTGLGILRRRRG